MHLWPGTKVAIGPAIADGFYYDFEFPEPVSADDLGSDRRRDAERSSRPSSRSCAPTVSKGTSSSEQIAAEHQPYKLELVEALPEGDISLYTQDGFEDLCRGPHLQTTKPIKAFKLQSLAGAYWRGDSHKPMLTRIYGTAFFDQAGLDEYLQRMEEAKKRDHRRIGRELDLFQFSETSPGSPFWHPKGMVIWNELTDAVAVAQPRTRLPGGAHADHLQRRRVEEVGPLGGLPREHVLHRGGERRVRAQADELPGPHLHLRRPAAQLPRPADAPLRAGSGAPPRALRHAARADPRAPHHPGRRPHLLHPRSDRGRGDRLPRAGRRHLRHLRARHAARALAPGPPSGSARTSCGTTPRRAAAGARARPGSRTS